MQLIAKPAKNGSLGMLPGMFHLRYHHPHGLIGVTMLPDPSFLLRIHPQGLRIVALMLSGNLLAPALLLCHLPRQTTPTTTKIKVKNSLPLGKSKILVDLGVSGEETNLGLGLGPMVQAETVVHILVRTIRRAPLMVQDTSVVHRLEQTMPVAEPTMTVTEIMVEDTSVVHRLDQQTMPVAEPTMTVTEIMVEDTSVVHRLDQQTMPVTVTEIMVEDTNVVHRLDQQTMPVAEPTMTVTTELMAEPTMTVTEIMVKDTTVAHRLNQQTMPVAEPTMTVTVTELMVATHKTMSPC
jgi:hypothetical protein